MIRPPWFKFRNKTQNKKPPMGKIYPFDGLDNVPEIVTLIGGSSEKSLNLFYGVLLFITFQGELKQLRIFAGIYCYLRVNIVCPGSNFLRGIDYCHVR